MRNSSREEPSVNAHEAERQLVPFNYSKTLSESEVCKMLQSKYSSSNITEHNNNHELMVQKVKQ